MGTEQKVVLPFGCLTRIKRGLWEAAYIDKYGSTPLLRRGTKADTWKYLAEYHERVHVAREEK